MQIFVYIPREVVYLFTIYKNMIDCSKKEI